MKKRSISWKKFVIIYRTIDKKITNVHIKIDTLKKELEQEEKEIERIKNDISEKKYILNHLEPTSDYNGLEIMFLRKGSILSKIDSLCYDLSICQQKNKTIYLEILENTSILNKLEKRKLAIEEIMKIYP